MLPDAIDRRRNVRRLIINKIRIVYCHLYHLCYQAAGVFYPHRVNKRQTIKTLWNINIENDHRNFTASLFSVAAFNASAQSVTATGTTLDSAEAVIAQKAKEINASEYKITSARMGNTVTMSAELYK